MIGRDEAPVGCVIGLGEGEGLGAGFGFGPASSRQGGRTLPKVLVEIWTRSGTSRDTMAPLPPPCRCDADPPWACMAGRGGWPWRACGGLLGGGLRGESAAPPQSGGEGALRGAISSREMMRSW